VWQTHTRAGARGGSEQAAWGAERTFVIFSDWMRTVFFVELGFTQNSGELNLSVFDG
jgi:hypothetical protein